MKILVADDHPQMHEVFNSIFKKQVPDLPTRELLRFYADDIPAMPPMPDYEITFVKQGREAIEMTQKALADGTPFDLAILDVRMPPGITGVAAAKEIIVMQPELQIILCTAFADFTWTDLLEHFPMGVTLVRKPFELFELITLAAILGDKTKLIRENHRRFID
jgi:CheY-like chemotaxis protein